METSLNVVVGVSLDHFTTHPFSHLALFFYIASIKTGFYPPCRMFGGQDLFLSFTLKTCWTRKLNDESHPSLQVCSPDFCQKPFLVWFICLVCLVLWQALDKKPQIVRGLPHYQASPSFQAMLWRQLMTLIHVCKPQAIEGCELRRSAGNAKESTPGLVVR